MIKKKRTLQHVLLLVVMLSLFIAGCANKEKRITTKTYPAGEEVVVEHEVIIEQAEPAKGEDISILGGLFNVIGEVIAFPFNVIGGALRLIF